MPFPVRPNLNDILSPLPTAEEMRIWDMTAVEFGIPENILMEHAGKSAADLLAGVIGKLKGYRICLFMGSGANGGDAACMARHLLDAGAMPVVFFTKEIESLQNSSAWHVRLARKDGVPFIHLPADDPASFLYEKIPGLWEGKAPQILVDGLLGTGFKGMLKPDMEKLVNAINAIASLYGCRILALDIPSGLNASTGIPSPVAIKATWTATFAAAKPGIMLAGEWTGSVYVRNICIPHAIKRNLPSHMHLLDGRIYDIELPLPSNSYKNVYGHIVIVGGSPGMEGAAHLACAAALRAGAGLVTACAPGASLAGIKAAWPEIMTLATADGKGASWPMQIPSTVARLISKATSLVIGPGMGRGEDAEEFLQSLLSLEVRPPTVFDADALIIMSRKTDLLDRLKKCDVLTPHPGEAAALLGCTGNEIQQARQDALHRLCGISKAGVVLKGAGTLIGQQGQSTFLCPYDIPQLAIGGAGDVLSGCIASQSFFLHGQTLAGAARGVATHALAGIICAHKYSGRGCLASNLADAIADVPAFVQSLELAARYEGLAPWPQFP